MKLRDFKIDNNEKMTLMGGMNVLESRDLAMEVAEKFKKVTDKNDINYIFNIVIPFSIIVLLLLIFLPPMR